MATIATVRRLMAGLQDGGDLRSVMYGGQLASLGHGDGVYVNVADSVMKQAISGGLIVRNAERSLKESRLGSGYFFWSITAKGEDYVV